LAGFHEYNEIKDYARHTLTAKEKEFLEKITKTVEDCEEGISDEWISFNDIIKLRIIWRKYEHLKPFQFRFDPRKKITEVFQNQTAFIIWTTWKSRHLVCQSDDIKGGTLAAAKILSEHKIPYSKEVKRKAVEEFLKYLHSSYTHLNHTEENELNFWEQHIFPFLEDKWKFKWKLKEED